jgi:dsDNA-specific endonuclease/ATPase MutS2
MTNSEKLIEDTKERIQPLVTLRDEIRLNLHLAGMDLRDEWKKIEKRFPELLGTAESLQDVASEALDEIGTELRRFSARIRRD